ncbi:MAG: hypothetical protein HFF18_14385 [Oscillospiraceae bacterium]|nr:hypothetical protein [Oscillospiraceae bacterium]
MKNKLIAFICVVACLATMIVPAFAVETRASSQIIRYSMDATTSKDTIEVFFSVTGVGTMQKIGCESIYIYEKSGTRWSLVETFTEDDSGMSRTNTHSHRNTIYYTGDADVEHKVVVTIFSEDDTERDIRTKTFYV